MLLADALTLDAPRRTADGYLAVRARAARTGVYSYAGAEVDPDNAHGLRDKASVNVLRDAETVFDEQAVHSFIGKPITNDHPREAVTASNWRDHARGTVMGAKWEEGGYLAFDLMLTDAAAIGEVEAGKRELSNGYSADLAFGDFTAPDGTKCEVKQTHIVGNHVAIVSRGRAGSECRIADAAMCERIPLIDSLQHQEKPVKTMLVDGLTVDMGNADTAIATVQTILAARDAANTKVAGLETKVATLTAEKATLDAEVTTLKQAVKDAKPTPQQLRDAGRALVVTAGKAKALGVTVTDEMDEGVIMAATVAAKMGDAAKGWSPEQVAASFAVLAKDVKVDDRVIQPIGQPAVIGDTAAADDARKAMIADMLKTTTTVAAGA